MDSVPRLKPIQVTREEGEGRSWMAEDEQPLSPMARMFHEPGSNVYIITMIGFKTRIHPSVLKDNMENTLLKQPRFSSLQVASKDGGKINWVPTKVNLDDHVIVPDLDVNVESPDKFVEDYVCNLSATTIDMSKPMWDFHLLDIKTSDAEAVGVFRVHHSLGDGLSLMSLLLACTRKASDPEALPATSVMKKAESGRSGGLQFLLQLVWNTIIDVIMFLLTALFLKDTETPLKGPKGVEHNPRRIVRKTVNLEDIKLVKNAMNATINDIVLGVSQAALSTYLNRRYGQIEKDLGAVAKKNYLPKNIRFRATFYMNLRPAVGIQALADMMEKGSKSRWGNEIGYVLLPLNIALKNDPLDHVREAKAIMNRKKNSLEVVCTRFIALSLFKLFGSKALGILSHEVFFHTTMWFSNVPGPQEEIAFCGHPITYVAPTCCGQPNALMFHIVSYMDKITFVLSTDEEMIPDPHQLCDDIGDALKSIKDGVLAKQFTNGK